MAGKGFISERENEVSDKMISKKFKCLHPGCGKMFNRKDYLARHAANHLPVRPYQCPICPSQFARQDLLEKHLSTKSHEKRQKREAIQRMVSASVEPFPPALYNRGAVNMAVEHVSESISAIDRCDNPPLPPPPPPPPPLPPPLPSPAYKEQQPISRQSPVSQGIAVQLSTTTTGHSRAHGPIPQRSQPLPSPDHQQLTSKPIPPFATNGVSHGSPTLVHLSASSPSLSPLRNDATMPGADQTLRSVPIKLLYDDSTRTEHMNSPLLPQQEMREQQQGKDFMFYTTHFAGVPPAAPAAQQQSPSPQLLQQQQAQNEPPSRQQYRPSESHQHQQSDKPEPRPSQQCLPQSQQPQSSQLQQQQQHSQQPIASADQYISYNSADPAVIAAPPASTVATEWPPFSLDSFDLSLSDHYTWLFGSDFWSDSPPETLIPSQPAIPKQENQQLQQVTAPLTDTGSSDFLLDGNSGYHSTLSQQLPKTITTGESAVSDTGFCANEDNSEGPCAVPATASVTPVAAKNSNIRNSPPSDMRSPLVRSLSESSRLKKDDKETSEEVRMKMIEVLKPIPEVTPDNPYFSLSAMKQYLHLYWVHFDPLYPILHRATFDPTVVEPALLIAIVTIGMAYSTQRDASNLAIVIHRKFRTIVFLMIEDQPQVQLWVHQTLLLTNYFDKMLGSTVQYDMSQFFHGTNIALMHFSGYLKGLTEPPVVETNDSVFADHQWRKWIEFETTKRTAFFAFICDTQHATLFRHSPILSAFEVRLELPSTDACWEAADGVEFYRMHREQANVAAAGMMKWRSSEAAWKADENTIVGPTVSDGFTQEPVWPSFLHSLKRLIRLSQEDQTEFQLANFSQFSCLILLHGLLSICWDMQWRGLLDMGIVSKRRMTEFKKRLEASFANWKSYFDYQLSKSNLPSITSAVMVASHSLPLPAEAGVNDRGESSGLDTSVVGRHQGLQEQQGHLPLSSLLSSMNDYNNSPMLCSNWAMFQLGLLALHVDTMSLRINAGSPNVLGRKIRAVDRENANKSVHQWARSDDGRLATWHSVQFMRRIAENESLLDQAVHIPWGVYLATLTIWSYEVCQVGEHLPLPKSGHQSLSRNNRKYYKSQHIEYTLAKEDAVRYLRLMNAQGDSLSPDGGCDMREGLAMTESHPSSETGYMQRSGSKPIGADYQMMLDPSREPRGNRNSTPAVTKSTASERQQLVIGLVAYSAALLTHIKWGVVVRGCEVLNNILKEYD
ncbi:fungal-specific transcription factor domain-containing protein [Lipomyces kononenkoae]